MKDFNEDGLNNDDLNNDDFNDDDLNDDFLDDEYYKAQKKRIRKREKQTQKSRRRYLRRQRLNRIKKGLQIVLKTTGSKSINYFKKCFDPTVIMPILASWFASWMIYREIDKMSTTINTVPIKEPEVYVDNSFSGQVKRFWDDNWVKIVTGSGVVLAGAGRQIYFNWQKQAMEKKLVTTQDQLVQSRKDLDQSHQEMDSMKRDHKTQIDRLHVTLNRFNTAALESGQRENNLRVEIRDCKKHIGELVDQKGLLEEQKIELETTVDEQEQKIQDLTLDKGVLSKRLEAANDEQAELIVKVENLEKDKSAGILKRRRLRRALTSVKDERKQLQEDLSKKKRELKKAEIEKKRLDKEVRNKDQKLIQYDKTCDDLNDQIDKKDKQLQQANANTDRCARRMDEVEQKLAESQETASDVTQQRDVLFRRVDKQSKALEAQDQEIDDLKKEVDTLNLNLGTTTFECNKLTLEIDELTSQRAQASEQEQKNFDKKLQEKEQELQFSRRLTQKFQKNLKKVSGKLVDSEAKRQTLSGNLVKLNSLLTAKKSRISELEDTVQTERVSHLATLQSERAAQDKKYKSAATSSQQLINELLDKAEENARKPWWQRFPLTFRFTQNVNIQQEKEKGDKKPTEYRFYPGQEYILPIFIREEQDPVTGEVKVSRVSSVGSRKTQERAKK